MDSTLLKAQDLLNMCRRNPCSGNGNNADYIYLCLLKIILICCISLQNYSHNAQLPEGLQYPQPKIVQLKQGSVQLKQASNAANNNDYAKQPSHSSAWPLALSALIRKTLSKAQSVKRGEKGERNRKTVCVLPSGNDETDGHDESARLMQQNATECSLDTDFSSNKFHEENLLRPFRDPQHESLAQITAQELAEKLCTELAKIGTIADALNGHLNFRANTANHIEQFENSEYRMTSKEGISHAKTASENMSPSRTGLCKDKLPTKAMEEEGRQGQAVQAGPLPISDFLLSVFVSAYDMIWDQNYQDVL